MTDEKLIGAKGRLESCLAERAAGIGAWSMVRPEDVRTVLDALAVFEKVYTPTDDEREALIEQATWALIEWDTDVADRGVRDEHYRDRRADIERVFPILFRRSEEPEWEYGTEELMHSGTTIFTQRDEAAARRLAWLYPVHRRRKAGPWVPVKQEGADDA